MPGLIEKFPSIAQSSAMLGLRLRSTFDYAVTSRRARPPAGGYPYIGETKSV